MKIFTLSILLSIFLTSVSCAESKLLEGFKPETLKESENLYDLWDDYVLKKDKDTTIYNSFTIPFYKDSKDSLLFSQVFNMSACGARNCPYKVFLVNPDGEKKLVLSGITGNHEYTFRIRKNGDNTPVSINTGIMVYNYDEKEGKYVIQK